MEPIRKISAKMLGEMAMADFCPRCFWLKLRMQNHLPFQKFAGISMVIDAYTKRIIREHYAQYGTLPRWFNWFGEKLKPIPVPHHSRFFWVDPETGIQVSGVPDEMVESSEGFCIIDYKTARWTERQNDLLPLYRVQVNGYARIAEACGYSPVTKLGLLYFEPQQFQELDDGIDTALTVDGFMMQFSPRYLEVEYQPQEILPPLLCEAKRLLDLQKPPLSVEGCNDCRLLEQLMGLCRTGPVLSFSEKAC
jgi:hypothetical protein